VGDEDNMAIAVFERLSEADRKKYAGQWVAVKDDHVVFAAPTPEPVVAWLREKGIEPDLVYEVPTNQELSSFY
jgi:hypothetical protein